MRKSVILIFLFVVIVSNLFAERLYFKGIVLQVMSDKKLQNFGGEDIYRQKLLVKLKNDKVKNKIVTVISDYTIQKNIRGRLQRGDNIIVEYDTDSKKAVFYDFDRSSGLYLLLFIFLLVIILVGKKKGIKSIIALTFTILLLFIFYVPLILQGASIIPLTILFVLIASCITIFILNGLSVKSFSAILGIFSGMIFAALFSFIMIDVMKLTGLSMQESQMLRYIPSGVSFDYRGILLAGILIGALGAIMDVGVELSASMFEIKKANPNISFKEHIKSGMNVGHDIIGTMTNTLVLAYVGTGLPLIMLFFAYKWRISKILNLDIIASEILRAFAGSIGLVLAIPSTIFIAALLLKNYDK